MTRHSFRHAITRAAPRVLMGGVLLLSACGGDGERRKELEASRVDVLRQVRHLRTLAGGESEAGDFITGNYRRCGKGSVDYVARTDWIEAADAGDGGRVFSAVSADLARDGWSIRTNEGPSHSTWGKDNLVVDLTEYPGRSIVRGYVVGECHRVDASADGFVRRPPDEYSK